MKKIKNGPFGDGKDITFKLKKEIQRHFFYFWENDRIAVFKDKIDYFNKIPFWIKEKIMCHFMFADVFNKTAF